RRPEGETRDRGTEGREAPAKGDQRRGGDRVERGRGTEGREALAKGDQRRGGDRVERGRGTEGREASAKGGQRRGGDRVERGSGHDRLDGMQRPLRRSRDGARPARPALPEGRPRLPVDVYRDLRGTAKATELTQVMQAFAVAEEALSEGDPERAVEVLTWARSMAARSPSIREALGVAAYLRGDFAAAHRELLVYRRLSGRHDQNHLLADCVRGLGRHEKVAEYIEQMIAAGVSPDRVAEGLLVLAGDRADRGDLRGALDALGRGELDPERVQPWHPRLWYLAGDLWERIGDRARARDYFEAITAVVDDFLDVEDRLVALSDGGDPGEER
ncbi:MAG: hypothetical protein ACRD0K_21225, partial [Egibacteraceae bacterium]